jgi:hypothetical protein
VREKLIEFLQTEYPHGLPRQRLEIDGQTLPAPARERRGALADAG